LTQFVSPDDEHDVLETCRELKIKINTQKEICVSRWSFTMNHARSTKCKVFLDVCVYLQQKQHRFIEEFEA
jgi:hypothetical protein